MTTRRQAESSAKQLLAWLQDGQNRCFGRERAIALVDNLAREIHDVADAAGEPRQPADDRTELLALVREALPWLTRLAYQAADDSPGRQWCDRAKAAIKRAEGQT